VLDDTFKTLDHQISEEDNPRYFDHTLFTTVCSASIDQDSQRRISMEHFSKWRMLWVVVPFTLAVVMSARAQNITILSGFGTGNGINPSLVQGTDGNFYGTVPSGGGGIAIVTPEGAENVMWFSGEPGPSDPAAGLVLGTDGNFYGTTFGGGAHNYRGAVFTMNPSFTVTTLYSFCARTNCLDGAGPTTALVEGIDGNFYGTTTYGGSGPCTDNLGGCGTVFKITRDGELRTLHRFNGLQDGAHPRAGLIQASDGNFYGTTSSGGANDTGTIFSMTAAGELTTLVTFCSLEPSSGSGCAKGAFPLQLVQSVDGNFYGIAQQGGRLGGGCAVWSGCGTVYKMTASGKLTTLHMFDKVEGFQPNALVQGTDGNFYGVTRSGGGGNNGGTLFRITPRGELTTLYSFCARYPISDPPHCPDGVEPQGLFQATDGEFYGTTALNGTFASGSFFRLGVEFLRFVLNSGSVGQIRGILAAISHADSKKRGEK
jgi:uncharacterized repeat protein (TIGR03803 family)